jgi:RNA polymerase sigma-70 factor (ECF subfamily)
VVVARDEERDREIGSLVRVAMAGDGGGFTGLYRLLAGPVAGFVRSLGVDEIDDVVNEVFLGAFRNLASFVGDGEAFRAWLFTIAHHKAVDSRRAGCRRSPPVDVASSLLRFESLGDVEGEALTALESADIDQMLAVLTQDQRDVVMLRVIADLSLEQVASALGKPVGAIKSIQHRAIATLQRAMSQRAVSLPGESANTSRRIA